MKELAVYQVKTRLSELLAEVEKGEQFVITRRGVAVARLVGARPAASQRSQANAQRRRVAQEVAQVMADLANLRRGVALDIPLREAIEQGRD
ncbi:MAG: type II toxin-antitoxin system prevent-host-death family antitoxin [Burkholderiales bacterium]|nr:type II toxin-antitoxin system prevent-host-death family antitoxin [Burkholderiales bacterium]MDE2566555.1 type II toxin-antitoxin system prevent-host-death family antitoxin [Burkholderiales bacterium]